MGSATVCFRACCHHHSVTLISEYSISLSPPDQKLCVAGTVSLLFTIDPACYAPCTLGKHLLNEDRQPGLLLSSVQSLSRDRLFATPWTAARQASLSITSSRSSLKLMSIQSVMPSDHLILCRPLLLLPSIFPSIRSFQMSQFFASGGQSIGASASGSVLPVNIQE